MVKNLSIFVALSKNINIIFVSCFSCHSHSNLSNVYLLVLSRDLLTLPKLNVQTAMTFRIDIIPLWFASFTTHCWKMKMNCKELSQFQFHFPELLGTSPMSKQEKFFYNWTLHIRDNPIYRQCQIIEKKTLSCFDIRENPKSSVK